MISDGIGSAAEQCMALGLDELAGPALARDHSNLRAHGPYCEIEPGNPGSPSTQHLPCFTPTFRKFDRPGDTAGGIERV
jgi:hypothetical protein